MESKNVTTQACIKFGDGFELDQQSYTLRRGGRALKLERIPIEILLLLVQRRKQIVTRKEIAARVWADTAFLDIDNSINGAVRKIRLVLEDDSQRPSFIQTITGQGYRFIAPVSNELSNETVNREAPPLPPQIADELRTAPPEAYGTGDQESEGSRKGDPLTTEKQRFSAWRPLPRSIAVGLTIVFLAVLGGLLLRSQFAARRPPSSARLMIAVLPFENLTGDPTQEYLSDGLTEEMITDLGNLDPQHLGVIARTSVMGYKMNKIALDHVGRDLGVQYVIEGSVRRDPDRIRVTAQLIQVEDHTNVWAREYDRELKGMLVVQGEIAHEIADEIDLTLRGGSSVVAHAASVVPNSVAYDLFLKGQYFLNKRTAADLNEAIKFFERATAEDPNYARAYAGLADSYALMGGYSGISKQEFMLKARKAALRALEIDDRLPEGHAALALIVQNYDWDWQIAEQEFRRAIELNPNYATAHQWYAEHLMWQGRFDEALQESELARRLDPLSLIIAADNGAILFYSRQYDRAIDKWNSVLEMDPSFRRAHLIASAYVEKGMFAEAMANAVNHSEIPASVLSWSAYVYGRSGQTARARRAIAELLATNRRSPIDPTLIAWAYAGVSDKDQALTWLEKGYAQHCAELVSLKVNPGYDALREEPRFKILLHRIGFAG